MNKLASLCLAAFLAATAGAIAVTPLSWADHNATLPPAASSGPTAAIGVVGPAGEYMWDA